MRKTFLFIGLILCYCGCSDDSKSEEFKLKAFPNAAYAKVVAYKMNGENKNVINKQNLLSSSIVGEGVTLTKKQEDRLLAIYRNKETYGDDSYRCFQPHLGFVFYDVVGKAVAFSTVCFECNRMRTSPDIGAFIFSVKGAKNLIQLEGDIFGL